MNQKSRERSLPRELWFHTQKDKPRQPESNTQTGSGGAKRGKVRAKARAYALTAIFNSLPEQKLIALDSGVPLSRIFDRPVFDVKLDRKHIRVQIARGCAQPRIFPVGLGDHMSFPEKGCEKLGIDDLLMEEHDYVSHRFVITSRADLSNWSTHVTYITVAIGGAPWRAFVSKALRLRPSYTTPDVVRRPHHVRIRDGTVWIVGVIHVSHGDEPGRRAAVGHCISHWTI
jgi:hypothetical protein